MRMDTLLAKAAERRKGLVYVSENCYGPDGYYAERPGWQQIADAAAGSAYVQGRGLGRPDGECVLPSLPVTFQAKALVGMPLVPEAALAEQLPVQLPLLVTVTATMPA